ncbi:hypothetical protein ACGFX4_29250 [Kitasatospora sp. NPDC048365]|uniref:hypothetical protein n=1 Tax=Kitasatospora sp. NPDC048365 TaxID=3364050 RepID=UPI00371BE843
MYEDFLPDEAQLRAAHAALGLAVPAEIEHRDEGRRLAALSAHLQRAMTSSTYNLVNCTGPDAAGSARRAGAVMPHGWPLPEDNWRAARVEMTFTRSRFTRLIHTDENAGPAADRTPGRVPWTDPREEDVELEAHAVGAEAALDVATDLVDLRLDPGNPELVAAALHTLTEHLGTLASVHRALLAHHGRTVTNRPD